MELEIPEEIPMPLEEKITITPIGKPPPVFWGLAHVQEELITEGREYVKLEQNERIIIICESVCSLIIQEPGLLALTSLYALTGKEVLRFIAGTSLPALGETTVTDILERVPRLELVNPAKELCVYENRVPPLRLSFTDNERRRLGIYEPPVDFIFNPGKKLAAKGPESRYAEVEAVDIIYENDYLSVDVDSKLVLDEDLDQNGQITLEKLVDILRKDEAYAGFTLVLFGCRSPISAVKEIVERAAVPFVEAEEPRQTLGDWWNIYGKCLYEYLPLVQIDIDEQPPHVYTACEISEALNQAFQTGTPPRLEYPGYPDGLELTLENTVKLCELYDFKFVHCPRLCELYGPEISRYCQTPTQ